MSTTSKKKKTTSKKDESLTIEEDILMEAVDDEAPEVSIEDLPGVGPATAEKLREAGFDELLALAVMSPGDLADQAELGEAVASKIINAAKKSKEACLVKLADKTSNIGAIANSPPEDWTLDRRLKYIAWANTVVGQLPYLPKDGLSEFLKRCDQAELNAYDDLGTIRKAQNAAISILERKAKRAGADEAQIRKFMLSFMQGAL